MDGLSGRVFVVSLAGEVEVSEHICQPLFNPPSVFSVFLPAFLRLNSALLERPCCGRSVTLHLVKAWAYILGPLFLWHLCQDVVPLFLTGANLLVRLEVREGSYQRDAQVAESIAAQPVVD